MQTDVLWKCASDGQSICEFYGNLGIGIADLIFPLFIWIAVASAVLGAVAVRLRFRLGRGAATAFVASFALVGGVAGEIAGATMESIVGASLSAILAIVSSMFAYLFGKDTMRAWRPVIPLALIAMLSSTVVGIVIGGSRRAQVIAEQRQADQDKASFDNIYAPVERERQITFYKKCISERTALDAANDCVPVVTPSP